MLNNRDYFREATPIVQVAAWFVKMAYRVLYAAGWVCLPTCQYKGSGVWVYGPRTNLCQMAATGPLCSSPLLLLARTDGAFLIGETVLLDEAAAAACRHWYTASGL